MVLHIAAEPVPLETGHDGVVRVRGSRVTLDTIVAAYRRGATAEEVVQQYPSLTLADIYAVIAYYLRRQPEVDAYLEERRQDAHRVRQENETRSKPTDIREHLLARRVT